MSDGQNEFVPRTYRKKIVSLSGGKDSTAMLLMMLEKGEEIDEIRFFDTGWEYPAMMRHLEKLERYINRDIKRLYPQEHSFLDLMLKVPVFKRGSKREEFVQTGRGWPHYKRRWCTALKLNTLYRKTKDCTFCVGIASDEAHRINKDNARKRSGVLRYPLVEWGMTERDCLNFCRSRGFDWDGLYNIFDRVSCFCCPLQDVLSLKKLMVCFPALWSKMLEWDNLIPNNRGFKNDKTLHQIHAKISKRGPLQKAYEDLERRGFYEQG